MANVDRNSHRSCVTRPHRRKITRGHPPNKKEKNMLIGIHQLNGSRIHRFHTPRTPLKDGPDDEDL